MLLPKPITCPWCAYRMDSHTVVSERKNAIPKPGDISVCLNCAAILEFEQGDTFKPVNEGVLQQMAETQPETFELLMRAVLLLKMLPVRTFQSRFN